MVNGSAQFFFDFLFQSKQNRIIELVGRHPLHDGLRQLCVVGVLVGVSFHAQLLVELTRLYYAVDYIVALVGFDSAAEPDAVK